MARDPAGTYSYPPGIEGHPDATIESGDYNSFLFDIQQDLNLPRPIVAGGTGATTAAGALANLGGELANQVVTNYNSFPFVAGSFYSMSGTTGEPVTGHNFIGICYATDSSNMVLEARDESDTQVPGRLYVREKKAGTWSAWKIDGRTSIDNGGGDVITGISGDAADMFFGLRGTSPSSYFTVNTKADVTGTNVLRINKDGSAVFTGAVTVPAGAPTDPNALTNKTYVDAGDAAANANANTRVLKAGDTMTGDLQIASGGLYLRGRGDPNSSVIFFNAAATQYLQHDATRWTFSGGQPVSVGEPVASSDATTVNWVNTNKQAALGFTPVTQGGANRVTLRWDGAGCRLQIDTNDTFGYIQTNPAGSVGVSNGRLSLAGDYNIPADNLTYEPFSGSVVTAMVKNFAGGYLYAGRWRYMQLLTTSWFTVGYV